MGGEEQGSLEPAPSSNQPVSGCSHSSAATSARKAPTQTRVRLLDESPGTNLQGWHAKPFPHTLQFHHLTLSKRRNYGAGEEVGGWQGRRPEGNPRGSPVWRALSAS